jgi:hypothetical protein
MDIVVKLPDKDYQVMLTKVMLACYGCEIIELPKGHGRLGDLDALEVEMSNGIKAGLMIEGYENYSNINDVDDCLECVKYADAIIEADRSEEE